MTDHAELRRVAEAATPGPWSCNRHWAIVGGPILEFTNGAAQQQIAMACGQSWMRDDELRNNAEFIAAANPQAILKLIAEVEHLRKDAARYRWLRERDLETIRQGGVFAGMTPENIVLNQEDLDAEIDAALEGATQ